MKPEDKQLLLKDLCGRLPYGVKYRTIGSDFAFTLKWIDELNRLDGDVRLENAKIFLRPLSSMTEGEKKEFIEYAGYEIEESVNGRHYEYYLKDFCGTPDNPSVNADGVDWLNTHHFDYRGLIKKDLAIEVTEENNPYK